MTATVVILVAALIVLAAWLARHLLVSHALDVRLEVRPPEETPLADPPPRVSVIVPARDEEANIAACLETLLAQDYPDFEVIVADDRSTDGTADVVRRLADGDPRLKLVRIHELPDGWFGKPHAMQAASRQADGAWLLFFDADCRMARGSLRSAVSWITQRGGDMLSLWPLLEMQSFAENLLQPLCATVLGLWFRPSLANDPRRPNAAFANGQFILVRRDVFDDVGGYACVRNRLVEDIAFARTLKLAGHKPLSAVGFDIFSTRMYADLRGIWRGWTRIFCGAFHTTWQLVLSILLVLLMSAGPFVLLVTAGVMAARAGWHDAWLNVLAAVGAAQLVAIASVLWRHYRMIRAQPATLWLYPLSVVLTLGILLCALATRLGLVGVSWRGRIYRGAGG